MQKKKQKKSLFSDFDSAVVGIAKKIIPAYPTVDRWVRAHKRQLYITAGGLLALWALYRYEKSGISKSMDELKHLHTTGSLIPVKETVRGMYKPVDIDIPAQLMTAKQMQAKFAKKLAVMDIKTSKIERAFASQDFKEWLKNNKGIVDLKKVR